MSAKVQTVRKKITTVTIFHPYRVTFMSRELAVHIIEF